MDNQQVNIPQQKSQKTNLQYVSYGLEVLLPLLILGLIFFLLNYLNILQFGKVFPFLSFLPHLPSTQNSSTSPNAKLTPRPTFKYDLSNGYKAFDTFTKDILSAPLLPLDKHPANAQTAQPNTNIGWASTDASVSATISYTPNTNSVERLDLFIQPKVILQEALTQNDASSEIRKYLAIKDVSSLKCTIVANNLTICEQFNTTNKEKNGVGIISAKKDSQTPLYFLFSCRVFPAYPSYSQLTSCVPPQHK